MVHEGKMRSKVYMGPNIEIDFERMTWVKLTHEGGHTMSNGKTKVIDGKLCAYIIASNNWRPFAGNIQHWYQEYIDECMEKTLLENR